MSYTIRCLHRIMDSEGWCAWLKEHSPSDVVFQYKEFGYNSHDVCLTPREIMVLQCDHYREYSIRVAESPCGRWSFGTTYGWGTSPCMFIDNEAEGYPDERSAVFAGLLFLERECKYNIAWEQARSQPDRVILAECKKVLGLLEEKKDRYDPRQLTLF